MFSSDDAQRKRRVEGNESTWAFEKKQRVEQLVTALAHPDKQRSSSTETVEGQEVQEDINIDVVSTDDPPSPITPTHTEKIKVTKPSLVPALSDNKSPSSAGKPVAKVVHFSPKIIQVDQMADAHHLSYTSKKGLFVPPVPLRPLMKPIRREAPKTMTRVPRDHNVPLIVYNPPRQKPQPPTTVIPVLPMTTVGNLIIQAPIFAGGNRHPPTLIPAAHFRRFAKHQQIPPPNFVMPQTKQPKPAKVPKDKKQQQQHLPIAVTAIKKEEAEIEDKDHVSNKKKTVAQWTVQDTYEHFFRSDCKEYAHIFLEQEIDGKALLHLDEINISRLLNVKMGPAIKMSAVIRDIKSS